MFLKSLEMQGFKSFADKTVLEFKPGITSAIGPNGSGKSNILDAIRWVLGEQSMKSLRGSKSEDIIFAGTENRKSLGFAEVKLVIDNSDATLPIEYNEVVVSRKIYRSGETGYFINKVPCRLKDILELFMDTGIGKDGYSIIGQGRIDEILSNKSEDRRHVFEEAAGIVKYRVRKAESEKKLEQTKLNLLRINDILVEIEAQLAPLKAQSDKAKQFLSLREELKNIEVGLFIHNISEYKLKLETLIKDLDIIEEQTKGEEGKLSQLQIDKDKLKLELEELICKIENTQNIGFESKNKIEKINSEISISKEKISNNMQNKERFEKEIENLKIRITDLNEEKENKISKKENLSTNKEKFEKELKEKEEELQKLTKKLSSKELEIEEKKKKIQEDTDSKYERLNELNTYNINFENLEKREKALTQELKGIISELDSSRLVKQDILKGFLEIDNVRNKALKQLEEQTKLKEDSLNKIKEFDENINKLSYEFRMKDSRLKFLQETEKEKDGYAKSVKSLLIACEKVPGLNKGIEGVLANLISVEKKYEVAIEMSLGQALQNIVAKEESDAKRLIEYLRSNSLGRASFLPISSIHGKKLEKINTRGINGFTGIASDLVKVDKKYADIILNLLGRTVIVENMESAIALAKQNNYSFRIVTLEGDLINPSGAITGGSIAKKTVNILGRSREIEDLQKEIEKLKKEIEKLNKQKEEYSSNVSSIIEKAEKFEKSLQEIEIKYATEKQKFESIEEAILKLENSKEKNKKEAEEIKVQKKEIEASKEGIKLVIENLEKEIEILNNEIKEFALKNKDEQEYIDNLNIDITDLKISVSSFDESAVSIEEMVERINNDINTAKTNIENKQLEIENFNKENGDLEQSIIKNTNEIEQIKYDVENSSTIIEDLKNKKDEKYNKQSKIEAQIEKQFEVINDLKSQRIRLDNKKIKQEQDVTDLINKLWEEYELTPNTAEKFEKPKNIANAQKQSNNLRNQIKELGSINIDSIEEYKKMQERYDFMNEQRYDLEESISKLRKVISEMTETMQKQFAARFKKINKNFNEVFRELFGGGKAELILQDEENLLECGIDIKAQPPGKKLQNMMLLSGGEKALTAIAILFAILKMNPAPFCVLDEIEAALDDINVERFATYLKNFEKNTQFLVITHRKGTMEIADTVYGVTMEEKGISKLLSMKLK